jgi:hypothetical protein
MDKFIKKLLAFCTANMLDYRYNNGAYTVTIDYLDLCRCQKDLARCERDLIKMCRKNGRSCSCGGSIYKKDFTII